MKKLLLGIFLSLITLQLAQATTLPDSIIKPQVRPSLLAMASYKTGNQYIKIVYGQPLKKGRVIFGGLEPYGKVWRTGANEATEITFLKDVKIQGKLVKAGTYTVFSVPNPDKWTFILNSELGQWGAYKYNPEKNLFGFELVPIKNDAIYEALTFSFNETDEGAELLMQWDDVKLVLPLVFVK
ncbi:MAG: DUF2911 domain-containing protein [Spirosomataceae bacterium]